MSVTSDRSNTTWRHRVAAWITVSLMILAPAAASQAAAFLYAVDEVDTGIRLIETATGVEINSRTLIISGVTALNRFDLVLGAAINPGNGVMYAFVDLKDKDTDVVTRKFVTIDPRSGEATDIAIIDVIVADIQISALAFAPNGTLYAVTSDDADVASTLYTVDLGSGALTFVLTLGNGLDGETIAFNPDDGKLYHSSGMGVPADKVFESIDLNLLTVTNIPLSGATAPGLQVLGLVYDAQQDLFLGFRNDGGRVFLGYNVGC